MNQNKLFEKLYKKIRSEKNSLGFDIRLKEIIEKKQLFSNLKNSHKSTFSNLKSLLRFERI